MAHSLRVPHRCESVLSRFFATEIFFVVNGSKSLALHPCQRPQLPSHSSVNNGHHGRFFLEPAIGHVRTKYRVRQQYPEVFETPFSAYQEESPTFKMEY